MHTCKSDGALGDDPLLEVLKSWGLHLVVTEVVPVCFGVRLVQNCKVPVLPMSLVCTTNTKNRSIRMANSPMSIWFKQFLFNETIESIVYHLKA